MGFLTELRNELKHTDEHLDDKLGRIDLVLL